MAPNHRRRQRKAQSKHKAQSQRKAQSQPNSHASNERNILDYLNEDCWRAVLYYVPVYDIVQTERTSKRWQKVVLEYLSHARIKIARYTWRAGYDELALNNRLYSSFKLWTYKLGSSIVALEKIEDTEDGVEILRRNCPNLEELKISFLKKPLPPNRTDEHFPNLKHLCIRRCNQMTDARIGEFLENPALEELKILTDERVTGQCLANLKSTKFKSLIFRDCEGLKFSPLLTASDRLTGLTKLVLARNRNDIRDQVHLLIQKMPNLEYLTVLNKEDYPGKADFFFDAVKRLENLKHFSSNYSTWDEHLEAVTRCCKRLQVLKLYGTHVTGRGIKAVCRDVGARLTEADFSHSSISENDVVSLVYACPNLTWLTISYCNLDPEELCPRVATARRELRAKQVLNMTVSDGTTEDDMDFYSLYDPEGLHDVLDAVMTEEGVYDSDGLEDVYRVPYRDRRRFEYFY